MSQKTRVLNVRVVGFSAPERQMLNSIFLLSVAPARQIGYKLWNSEGGTAPDMYLLDGDSESAVASWQAAFSNAFERTLVVGSKNTDLGCTSASRPLGLKVVGAMDRLAIALNNVAKEPAGLDVSGPRGGTLPTGPTGDSSPTMPMPVKQPDASTSRPAAGMAPQPTLSASMAAAISSGAPLSATLTSNTAHQNSPSGTLPSSMPATMTAAAPAATVLPSMTLTPSVAPGFEKTISDKVIADKPAVEKPVVEKPLTEKTVDRMLSDKAGVERVFDRPGTERVFDRVDKPALPPISGATPLSPSALAAAVAPSPRAKLHVVPPSPSPAHAPVSMAASLPSAASVASVAARIADAPMNPAPAARVVEAPVARSIADAPMNPPATRVVEAPVVPVVPVARPVVDAPVAPVVPVARIADAPMNPPAPVVTPPPAPAAPVATPAARPEETFRVLTVDDSPLMRTFLQNKLAPYGISPEFAASGEEALYKISKQHFDLIFLDVMLPGMDGYDVCKMIKKNKDNNLMKVVMLTSKDKTFDKIRGTMAGCDGYLTKPVDEMKLRAIIERHTPTTKPTKK